MSSHVRSSISIPNIRAQQFYTGLGHYEQDWCKSNFMNFSRPYYPLLFKANLKFNDFSRKCSIFQGLFRPVQNLFIGR